MGKLKQKSAPYCLFILVFYLAEAIFLPYVVMYLTETGMTTAQASLAYSGMNIGAIIGGLGLGYCADRTRNPRGTLACAVVLSAGLILLLRLGTGVAFGAAVLFLFGFLEQPAIDLFDNLLVQNVKNWEKAFSVVHSFGNLGYVLGLLIAGGMLTAYGYGWLFGAAAVMLVISGISCAGMGSGCGRQEKKNKVPFRALFRNHMSVAIYLVSFLWGVIETGTLAFATKYYTDLGYTASYAAMMISIAIAGQVLSYTWLYRNQEKVSQPMLCFGGFALLALRIISMALVGIFPQAVLVVMACLGGACTPLINLALVQMVSENFPVEVSNSAQTFKTIAYRGAGGSLGSYLFGLCYGLMGGQKLMLLGAVVSVALGLVALASIRLAKSLDRYS